MELAGTAYSFVMIKNPKHDPKEPYIYFISDLKDAKVIANHYLKRWKIESCYRHLKSNGFNMEDINLQNDQKIELMMGVLAVVYLLAVKEGILRHKSNPIKLIKYKNGKTYFTISIFRMGLAIIQTLFTGIFEMIDYIDRELKAFAVVPPGSEAPWKITRASRLELRESVY
jgi:hypothetical protein